MSGASLAPDDRAELRGRIREKPVLWRYLRVTSRGLLCVDKAKIAAEARLDGKTLLRTAEIAGNDIWRNLSAELDRIQLHAYDTCHGTVS